MNNTKKFPVSIAIVIIAFCAGCELPLCDMNQRICTFDIYNTEKCISALRSQPSTGRFSLRPPIALKPQMLTKFTCFFC